MNSLLYFLSAFGLGAAHALEPGHGKTLVAAYLTGAKGKVSDAFLLGLLVTLCHTVSVFVLGLVGVLIADVFIQFKADFLRSLELVSGLMILGIGLLLFWRRFIKDKDGNECECHIRHVHHAGHSEVEVTQKASNFKEVLSLGIASGITPCPIAIAALIASISLGGFSKLPEALIYLLIFSVGLSSVLVIIGLALILSAGKLSSLFINKNSRIPVYVSRFSTLLIVFLGLYLTAKAMFGPTDLEALGNSKQPLPAMTSGQTAGRAPQTPTGRGSIPVVKSPAKGSV